MEKVINKHLISMGVDVRRLDQESKISAFIQLATTQGVHSQAKIDSANVDSDTLVHMADFLGIRDLVTGTKTISLLYRAVVNTPVFIYNIFKRVLGKELYVAKSGFFNHEFKFNWGPFEYAKRRLINYQIQRQISKIRT